MKNNTKGFTLIELLVVVLIIGILAAIALPQYFKAVEKSRAAEALSLFGTIAAAEQRYYLVKDGWTDKFTDFDIDFTTSQDGKQVDTQSFKITLDKTNGVVLAERLSGRYTGYKLKRYIDSSSVKCVEGTGQAICNTLGIEVESAG